MDQIYTIPLARIAEDFHLEVVVRPDNFEEIQISSPEVNRPGLALAGFYEVFETDRIQLIGYAETQYLHSLEPSTKRVMLQKLVDAGNTLVVIEHNLDVIKCADFIVDLGPEGGDRGGTVVACGTPEEVAAVGESYTGHYLKALFEKTE